MKPNLSAIITICTIALISSLSLAKQKSTRDRTQKPSAESEQAKADILAGKSSFPFYYKGPECLPESTWQMARIQSPKEVLGSNAKCVVEVPKFELSDTKGKKLSIKCGFNQPLNYFVDEESCTKFHDGKFKR